MTALITGSNGFLGTALVDCLLGRGERDLRCLVRVGSNKKRLEGVFDKFGRPSSALVVQGDLSSPLEVARYLDGVDTVYHLAAALSGEPADMFLNTVVASKHLLEAIGKQATPPRIVLVSSFSVYGVAELPRDSVIDENTPLESHPEKRDIYAQTKRRQERLFEEYQTKLGFDLVTLRPGVIYGPTGGAFSGRVGIGLPGLFLYLGGTNLLPLSYVDNCADAIAVAGRLPEARGQAYNVHDDDLPTCSEYFGAYEAAVAPMRRVSVPYAMLLAGSYALERYHRYSGGQLPAVFTPYKTRSLWKGHRFDNHKLKSIGWTQRIPTSEGMRLTFEHLSSERLAKPT